MKTLVLDANILIRAVLGQRSAAPGLLALEALIAVVCPLGADLYSHLQRPALARIAERDPDDWPTLACALLLGCPIWSEDADFFGTGVATWTTSRIGVFFELG